MKQQDDDGQGQGRQRQQSQAKETEYLNFINSLRSQATITMYDFSLRHYMQYIETNSVSNLVKLDSRTIEQQLITYLVDLRRNQKLSYASLAMRLAALGKFYEMNDVVLNWKKVSNYLGENTKIFKDRAYATEEIQQLLIKADERGRVVILLLASTGMRIGAIPGLKLKHLTKITEAVERGTKLGVVMRASSWGLIPKRSAAILTNRVSGVGL